MNRLFNTPARVLRPTTGGLTGGLMTRALLGVKTSPLDDDYMSTKLNDSQHPAAAQLIPTDDQV